jgi:putative redox protein
MKDAINVKWVEDMSFETLVNDHPIILDATPEAGGRNRGPRPKPLLMVSLAGCTAMDVVSILKKMKVDLTSFNIHVEADISDEHPKRYTTVHLIYEFCGKDLSLDKLKHAIELSQEKYCGVSATLKNAVEISYEIKIVPLSL